jgi:hypothetical protein
MTTPNLAADQPAALGERRSGSVSSTATSPSPSPSLSSSSSSSRAGRGRGRGDPATASAAGRQAAVRRRRRPGLWAAGVALVAVGGLGAAALVEQAGDRVEVLAVARPVPVGQLIATGDLAVARVAADPSLRPVPASERARLVGRVAAVNLRPGTLLTAAEVTDTAVPAAGEQLVGVAVRPGQLPASGVRPGDQVLLVPVPGDQTPTGAPVGAASEPSDQPTPARVAHVGAADTDGVSTVDVVVAAATGPQVAALASTGRVALVLLPAGGS